jgi:alpha-glucosidase
MDLHKIPYPDNFAFAERAIGPVARRSLVVGAERLSVSVRALGEDVFRLELQDGRWPARRALSRLSEPFSSDGDWSLAVTPSAELCLARRSSGAPELRGPLGATFGVSGRAFLLRLVPETGDRYFGMGEKWGPLEKSGQRSQFWTTDVWSDFTPAEIGEARIDSPYIAVPYLIIERAGVYFGLLLDNPYPTFMATNPQMSLTGADPFGESGSTGLAAERLGQRAPLQHHLYLGSADGRPIVYFLVGPSLRELTRKLQRLVGTTPRPPLWALGHQQCRWGYRDLEDLSELDEGFARARVPNDGLWLDIDYMEGYRVFSLAPGVLPDGPDRRLERLRQRRRRLVAILDPGVKVEPGYSVYEEGLAGSHFCLAPSGRPYVGIVWPGRTHFPDFSQATTRDWWSEQVAALARRGFDGFWIDMNDPSTGPVENRSMLFSGGRWPHEAFHNQYALGMAMATRAGLELARPTERPFVLSRSAFTGAAAFTAVWTGDNVSSFRHLAASIPISLNLALSGLPFNGPDVPGFGGEPDDELAVRFYQATCLFPFLRNHSVKGSRRQEPWTFGPAAAATIRRFIRLRYRLLPYLYQLFIAQERRGEPLMLPAFADGSSQPDLQHIEDQYLLGSLLAAPVVTPGSAREVWLPPGAWYCLRTGAWLRGGRRVPLEVPRRELPLYVRSGSVLPMAREAAVVERDGGAPRALRLLTEIDLHIFLAPGAGTELDYEYDDGQSVEYEAGVTRLVRLSAQRRGSRVEVELGATGSDALPPLSARVVLHGGAAVLTRGGERLALRPGRERLSGGELPVLRSARFRL